MRVQLSSGEYTVLDDARLEKLAFTGPPKKIVDAHNRPAISEERRKILDRLEEFRWWESDAHFPDQPDELRQLEALKTWFLGFGVTAAMLMAPVIACFAVLYSSRASIGMEPTVGAAIAIVSLMLLLLIMERLARPVWGKPGDPVLLLRRPFVLLLPTSVIATIWWLSYPMRDVRLVGLVFPLVEILILIALVAWFLVLYFRYTGQKEMVWARLDNATPRNVVAAFYDLVRPRPDREEYWRNLETAVQYLEPFLRSTYLVGTNGSETGSWVWPSAEHPKSLRDLGTELSKGLDALFQGDRLLDVELREVAMLKRSAAKNPGQGLLACCAVETRSSGGVIAAAPSRREGPEAEMRGRYYTRHELVPAATGWFLESGRFTLLPDRDAARLRETGSLS